MIAPVPTLDAISAQPESVRGLPRETLLDLFLRAQSTATVIGLAMLMAPKAVAEDRVLTCAETAAILGVSESLVKRGVRSTYKHLVVRPGGRTRGFSARQVQEFIRRKTGT